MLDDLSLGLAPLITAEDVRHHSRVECREKMTILLVEQDANQALGLRTAPMSSKWGGSRSRAPTSPTISAYAKLISAFDRSDHGRQFGRGGSSIFRETMAV